MEEGFLKYANKQKNSKLLELECLFQIEYIKYISMFRNNFSSICETIIMLQKTGNISDISYIEYTMLYTNFINKRYMVDVRVYNEDWYLDKKQISVGHFDVSFIFNKYEELWEQLLTDRKMYNVNKMEIVSYILTSLPDFYSYVTSMCRFGIIKCTEKEIFKLIKKTNEFEINVGEYMARTEPIYKENGIKNQKLIDAWFNERFEHEYAFEDFTGLNFSSRDFSEIDFRYSDFRHSYLNNVNLQDSLLIGTRFCFASMEYTDFSYCTLYEADFTGANLENAKFVGVVADAGIMNDEMWDMPGYIGVSFCNANLQNADFTKSNFIGADFTGAILKGAIFNNDHVMYLELSKIQRDVIVVK